MRILILFFICSLFLFSCSSRNSDSAKNKNNSDSIKVSAPAFDTSFEKGKVISKIKCVKDSSVSYALYLPQNYSVNKKTPIIYFFDSHGSGSLPLEKYKELAEKYGYILAGSNNSKNGMSWEQNHPQIKTFMSDVKQLVNIDSRRIYVCGFSGGSRVASSIAIFDGGINSVIGMGAGFPSLSEPIQNHFDYIGFAGNEDFNMNEMLALSASMDQSPIRHRFEIFNGKHEWAPADIAEDAFVWIEFNAMKDGLISKNDSLIKNFALINNKQLKILAEKNDWYNLSLLYKKLISFLDGLYSIDDYKEGLKRLEPSAMYKEVIKNKSNLAREETTSQETYRNNFVLKDLAWWITEIKKLNQLSKNKNDEERAIMNKRLLNYLSLLAYMNASSALQANNFDDSEKFLKIYQQVDPENSEHQYLFADLYARKNDNAKVFSSLKNAVKLGFNDVARMQSDPSLLTLHDDPEFIKIMEQVKNVKPK